MGHGGGSESGSSGGSHLKDGFIDLFAGTMGGIANVYAGQPLDTVKVKVQTFPKLYANWVTCLKDTYRIDGVRGLYAGTVPALAANIAENAVLFCAYGYCQKLVGSFCGHEDSKFMSPIENAVAGSFAAVFAATVLCPTELVKCRLQAARETNPTVRSTPFSVCRNMLQERGPRGFFIGMTPTLAREVPGYFCFFGAYELCRFLLTPEGKTKDDIGLFRTAISGSCGGMALWAAIFPADVIKSRMQVQGGGNFGDMFKTILKEQGFMGFYKGLLPTLIRTAVASGHYMTSFRVLRFIRDTKSCIIRNYSQPFFKVELAANKGANVRKRNTVPEVTKKFKQRIAEYLKDLNDPLIEKRLGPLRASVREVAAEIKSLKEREPSSNELPNLLHELKRRKTLLENTELELAPQDASFDRTKIEDLLIDCHFFRPAFSLYSSAPGLFYFGQNGSRMVKNIISTWEDHFVMEDEMNEIISTSLTPESVFVASGHTQRFADLMVKDTINGELFRADHFLLNSFKELLLQAPSAELKKEYERMIERIGDLDELRIEELIKQYDLKSPSGNPVSKPTKANQMLSIEMGFNGDRAFLRPETAQGIFVEFQNYLEANKGKLPFAVAQVGTAFRNEINPRHGLLRTREFQMCEIEHFHDPQQKTHHKFDEIADRRLVFYPQRQQLDGASPIEISVREAVDTLIGYYLARTHSFLEKVGINTRKLRFRQHMANEMAHYAKDCWDAEVMTSYGWIECAGIADRGVYDLEQHSRISGTRLTANRDIDSAEKEALSIKPNMNILQKAYPDKAKKIQKSLSELNALNIQAGTISVTVDQQVYQLMPDMYELKKSMKSIKTEAFIPAVIEPSFGIGRIFYAALEHSFLQRDGDEKRVFLNLNPVVAPIKCSVLPINSNAEKLQPLVKEICKRLHRHRISYKLDDSNGSIGRRYARTDKIGIPFGVTIDFESIANPPTVTVRNALNQAQIRVQIDDLCSVLTNLINGSLEWSRAEKLYPYHATIL
ncbi:unnamed protein product, partial [Mesorhabditis belari]|uniref:glycine--tRNA ligase n=1 Tax=Mesorhabditis belari TaxID=2138241 RepID=A0AAF3J1Z9_9BILA